MSPSGTGSRQSRRACGRCSSPSPLPRTSRPRRSVPAARVGRRGHVRAAPGREVVPRAARPQPGAPAYHRSALRAALLAAAAAGASAAAAWSLTLAGTSGRSAPAVTVTPRRGGRPPRGDGRRPGREDRGRPPGTARLSVGPGTSGPRPCRPTPSPTRRRRLPEPRGRIATMTYADDDRGPREAGPATSPRHETADPAAWDEWSWPGERAEDTRPVPVAGGAPVPVGATPAPGPAHAEGTAEGTWWRERWSDGSTGRWVGAPPRPRRRPDVARRGARSSPSRRPARSSPAVLGASSAASSGSGAAPSGAPARWQDPDPRARGDRAAARGSVANIAANALPSVVTIRVEGGSGAGTGSGFVLDRQGHVITNNHVVAAASGGGSIAVQLANGRQLDATLVGRDASYDLAVLEVGRKDLTPLPDRGVVRRRRRRPGHRRRRAPRARQHGDHGDRQRPRPSGERRQRDDRSYINAIQTDAAINPGEQRGSAPRHVGQGHRGELRDRPAPRRRCSSEQSGSIGLGFAIPSDQVRTTATSSSGTGTAEHPVIGVVLDLQLQG